MADRNLAVVKPVWMKQAEEAKLKNEAEKAAAAKAASEATFKDVEKTRREDFSDSEGEEESEDLANKPVGPVDPAKCTAAGTGIAGGTACLPSSFVVVTKDSDGRKVPNGGAQIKAKVLAGAGVGVSDQDGIVKDMGDGSYTVTYVVPKRGNYMVNVECNGKPIMDSPFPVFFSQVTLAERDSNRRHTRLLVDNPSHLSESGYQGVGPSLETFVVGVWRSYHLAEDAFFRRDEQHALQALAEIRDLLYEAIQYAHQGDRLHFGHYDVHSAAAAPDTLMPSTSMPSTSALATSRPWTSVTPPHATPYMSPDSLHVHPTQHTGIPYVADPDWTPHRYMHEVVTPPTQLQPPHSSGVCSVGVDTCTSHTPTLHTPTFVETSLTATMSTHDAVLTDISYVQDKAYIEALPRARGRGRGYGRGRRRGRGRGTGRGRGRGLVADRDTVAPDEGVSQLTAVSDVGPERGLGAAQAGERGSQS
ncbi:Gelation factor [Camellia lanceoleosa]|uniref:Gelation factor n=1 Tax=Camellia lanceoleosa TaxID=1840588 RepID=A0ACC0HJC1_9ERIC|nr:Gelation factor [Camellia lanceoleosa]